MLYGLKRVTSDLDFIECRPIENSDRLIELAGRKTYLHQKYGLYLQRVTVATLPENYKERLSEIFGGAFKHLSLWVPDQYDLALTKLTRNFSLDIEDVKRIGLSTDFNLDDFKRRYDEEFRVYIEDNPRHSGVFEFWVEMIREESSKI